MNRKVLTRALALALVFAAVLAFAGNRPAEALESGPVLYRYLGGDGTYTVGEEIRVIYKYSPCYKYEYTYCELYDSAGEKLATTSHAWTNTSTDYRNWTVKIDTFQLALTAGVYRLKSYVYYKYNGQYITTSVSWSTFYLRGGASIELNREEYTYTVSYIRTSVPAKTIKLTATVEGSANAVTWTSSDRSVATVNAKGKVTMRGFGTCAITASVDGISASCRVTVKKQTGIAYYKKVIKPIYEDVLDCIDEPFEDLEEMRENCDMALEEALELKDEIFKVKKLKNDSLIRKYISVVLTNLRKADDRAWMDGISIHDANMTLYCKTALKYLKKLNTRARNLLD